MGRLMVMDPLEEAASRIVGAVTKWALKPLDPGGGAVQLPDFEIVDSNGIRMGVMEVTTTTREERARFRARVGKQDWQLAGLSHSWIVVTDSAAEPKLLAQTLGQELQGLEIYGRTGIWIPDRDTEGLPVSLAELGVVRVCAYQRNKPGKGGWVSVQPLERSGLVGDVDLTQEVQHALDRADNQAKLRVCGGGTGGTLRLARRWRWGSGVGDVG